MSINNINENLKFFADRQNTSLSYSYQIDSNQEGPHLMFVGGLHGSEPSGVEAIVRFTKYLEDQKLNLKKGKITFVLGNAEAYKAGVRLIDENLNRSFLKIPNDNTEGRRSLEFRHFFEQNKIEMLVDLHSVSVGNWQMVAYLKSEFNQNFALELSPIDMHFIIDPASLPGSLIEEVENFGAKGIVIECGNHTSTESIEVAYSHIQKAILLYEMLEAKDFTEQETKDSKKKIKIYESVEAIRPKPGFQFVNPEVNTGDFVKKGQVYATFNDGQYTAPVDCHIVMPDKNPSLKDNDAGFLCILKEVEK